VRIGYLFVWWPLRYSLRLFYRSIELINSPESYFGRTIYMSNHSASFMDPLVIACFRKPIVFFMTRSDVFSALTKHFMWSMHMLPIYRQLDGVNTKEKNAEVFKDCSKVLKSKRNLLVFAEGFTDDVFVRRLKPIKKGAIRIGFSALEYMDWSEKIYIAAIGCNYTEPNRMRSDLLIATSESICLNEYRKQYEENPNKVISELTLLAGKMMREQITHIENPHLTSLHETIMILTRRGMNSESYNEKLSLSDRYDYSKRLANWINQEPIDRLEPLKEVSEKYVQSLSAKNITDDEIWRIKNGQLKISQQIILLLLLIPFNIIGAIHCALPYFAVKYFVENKFKRAVFWGSTKMLLLMILIGVVNIPIIFLFDDIFHLSNWWGFVYYLLIGVNGLCFYKSFTIARNLIRIFKIKNENFDEFYKKRDELNLLLENTIPRELL